MISSSTLLFLLSLTPLLPSLSPSFLSLSPPLANEYGLFYPDDDPTKGRWLEQGTTLDYYHLKMEYWMSS